MRTRGQKRDDLRHFLQARRARLSPHDVGMPARSRRNTSGLRREEVAALAGVSASWYTWLEQGRDIKVSGEVLTAISDALNLDVTDRSHLFLLAGLNPPPAVLGATLEEIARLRLVVEGLLPMPAYIVDRYWTNLASNDSACRMFGARNDDYNYLTAFFTDLSARKRYIHWPEIAARLVGQFRVQSARFPGDPHFERLAAQLSAASPEFAEIWSQHATWDSTMDYLELRMPDGRAGRFERITLGLLERYDLRLVLHVPMGGYVPPPDP